MDCRRLHFGMTLIEIVTTCIHAFMLLRKFHFVTASCLTYALDASEAAVTVL